MKTDSLKRIQETIIELKSLCEFLSQLSQISQMTFVGKWRNIVSDVYDFFRHNSTLRDMKIVHERFATKEEFVKYGSTHVVYWGLWEK